MNQDEFQTIEKVMDVFKILIYFGCRNSPESRSKEQ